MRTAGVAHASPDLFGASANLLAQRSLSVRELVFCRAVGKKCLRRRFADDELLEAFSRKSRHPSPFLSLECTFIYVQLVRSYQ